MVVVPNTVTLPVIDGNDAMVVLPVIGIMVEPLITVTP